LAALLTRLLLAASLLTTLMAALARLLIGLARLLLATLVRIVCLVHALLLLPPALTKPAGAMSVPCMK
jgi:hypothetical protein